MTTLELQRSLVSAGFNPGPLDGKPGAKTTAAVKEFQASRGLDPDGKVGPKTLEALNGGTPVLTIALSRDVIKAVAPAARNDIAEGLVAGASLIRDAKIDTRLRLAHFLTQIAVESAGLTTLEESLYYKTASRIREVWPSRFPSAAAAAPYVKNPQALANKVYGGRMGNKGPNDGWLYRGGGLIQTTGFDNYKDAEADKSPDTLRAMPGALVSALRFWSVNKLNELADRNDLLAIRKRVNGGTHGYDEAKTYSNRAAKALKL